MIAHKNMRIVIFFSLAAGFIFLGAMPFAEAQVSGQIVRFHSADENGIGGIELRPQSSIEHPGDAGVRIHTHLRILVPNGRLVPVGHDEAVRNRSGSGDDRGRHHPGGGSGGGGGGGGGGQSSGTSLNTPSSIACVYNLVEQPASQPPGCDPEYTTGNPAGGGGAIALVDAYDDPSAAADIAYFSQYFALPVANFQVVYAGGPAPYITGSRPSSGVSSGWNIEEALDIEWAHAMAPEAKIFLVEAQGTSNGALFTAVLAAEYLVSHNGGGEVSMSWGGSEFGGETAYDAYFSPGASPPDVIFVASAGDTGGVVEYPATSPYVIAAGGTTVNRNSSGSFVSETAWSDTGGGISAYEARPSYQAASAVESVVGAHRGTPDISMNADPNTGVAIYVAGDWYAVGGTSVASPSIAGVINVADNAAGEFPAASGELGKLYADDGIASDFRDITSGRCGRDSALISYDLCTGWGSPLAYTGK
jgi:kumamolisin